MTTVALVQRIEAAGCSLALEGGAVKLRGPREALTPELIAEARHHKPELLAALRGEADPCRAAGDLAAEVNAHLETCRACQRSFFTTDDVTPCCRVGADLKRRYRDARKWALATS